MKLEIFKNELSSCTNETIGNDAEVSFFRLFFFFKKKTFSFLGMEFIFGETNLIKEYKLLINEILRNLNECKFCNKLHCEYCKKYSLDCGMFKKERCLKCLRFIRSKDILINSNNKIISDYLQNFLIDFFNVSNFSNSFFDDLHADNLNKSNILDIEQIFQSIKSIDNSTKKKKFF